MHNEKRRLNRLVHAIGLQEVKFGQSRDGNVVRISQLVGTCDTSKSIVLIGARYKHVRIRRYFDGFSRDCCTNCHGNVKSGLFEVRVLALV